MEDLQKDINSMQGENGTEKLLICSHSNICNNSIGDGGGCMHGVPHKIQEACAGECFSPTGIREARCYFIVKQWD